MRKENTSMKDNICESCKIIRKKNNNKIDQCKSCLISMERRFNWFKNIYVRDLQDYEDFV